MSFNWFVSVDDHLIEPARLWQERVPAALREHAPHIVRDGDSEFWVYEDRQIVTTGLNAVAGKRREEFSPEPITYDDMRPGCYEPAERVADMNQGYVLSSHALPVLPPLLRPGLPRGQGQGAGPRVRPGLERLHPGGVRRRLPRPLHPDDDHPAVGPCRPPSVEIERTAARGAKSIAFSENPTKLGLPSIHTDVLGPRVPARPRRPASSCRCTSGRRRT